MNNNKLLSQMCQTPLDLYHNPGLQNEYFSLGPCPVTAPRWVHVRHSMIMMDVATSLSQSQWPKGRYKWCKGKRTISLGCVGTGVNNSASSFTKFWGCRGMSQVEYSMCLMFGWQEKKEKEASGNCREKTHLSSRQTGTRQSFPINGHPLSITLILTSSFVMWLAQSNHEMLSQEASSVPFSGCQEAAASGPSIGRGCPGVTQVTAWVFLQEGEKGVLFKPRHPCEWHSPTSILQCTTYSNIHCNSRRQFLTL